MKKLILLLLVIGVVWFGFKALTQNEVSVVEQEETQVEDTQTESAPLKAVGKFTGSGNASRAWNGTTYSFIVFTNLGPPDEGTFYEGWIVRPEPFEFVSTGKLIVTESGYGGSFSMDRDFTSHKNVVITEETEANGLDCVPEAHVLEGSF